MRLGLTERLVAPIEVEQAALEFIGTPYRRKGRPNKETGVTGSLDCIGLLLAVAWRLGIDGGYDFLAYPDWPDGKVLRQELMRKTVPDAKPTPELGKIGLWYAHGIKRPLHVMLFGSGGTVIDPSSSELQVVRYRYEPARLRKATGLTLIATTDYVEVAAWRAANERAA